MKKNRFLATPFSIWMVLFTIVPLGIVVWFAFTNENGAFTFANITDIGNYMGTLLDSIWIGFASTVICLLLAFPLAFSISRATERVQQTMVMIVMLPMWMNFLLRTYVWMSILEPNGFFNQGLMALGLNPIQFMGTDFAIILVMVYNFLPFMVLPLYSVMMKIDPKVIESAQDLGASGRHVLGRVILPLSVPGILAGITMVFVPAVSTFIVTNLVGNGKKMMIGDLIEQRFIGNAPNMNVGSALSLVLMVLILLCILMMNAADKNHDTGEFIM